MRIGLIGPAVAEESALLREAAEFLLADLGVDHALYLGNDEVVDAVARSWAADITGGDSRDFVARSLEVAVDGDPEAIDAFLSAEQQLARLAQLHTLPPAPARAVEMIDDRIVLAVFDKSVLDEEDIANAHLIVYGRSSERLLKRFGHRYFFTPGPLAGEEVGVIEVEEDGSILVATFAPSGVPVFREVLAGRSARVTVT